MIGVPPSFVGAVQCNVTCALPGVPVNDIGASGTASVDSVILAYAPGPTAFTAATLKSYNVPSNNPVTMQCSGTGVSGMSVGTVVAVTHVPLTLH